MRIDAYNQVAQLYGIQKNLKTFLTCQKLNQDFQLMIVTQDILLVY